SQHGATAILDGAGTVIVQFLVVMCIDVAAWKHGLDVGKKLGVDGHHVFEVAMNRAVFNHPDFAVALDNLGLDFADLFVDQNTDVFLAADDLFARFDDAVRTEGVSGAWPPQGWLALLPGFQQGFVLPFGSKRRIRLVFIYRLNCVESAPREQCQCFLSMLNRSHHLSVRFNFMASPRQTKAYQGRRA